MQSLYTEAVVDASFRSLQETITNYRADLGTDLAAYLGRPARPNISQRRTSKMPSGEQSRRFSIKRADGNLIIYRGVLLLAELQLDTLLAEADAATLGSTTLTMGGMRLEISYADCMHHDTVAFIRHLDPRASIFRLYLTGLNTGNGARMWEFEVPFFLTSSLGDSPCPTAQSMLDEAYAIDTKLQLLSQRATGLALKRKVMEEYEEKWVEDKRLKKRLRVD
jgi:hypothetical protein